MYHKKFKLITASAAIALIALGSSCNKISSFGDTNSNPNVITSPVPYALITNVEWQLGGFASNVRSAITCQYFSEAEYPSIGQYAIPQVDFAGTYTGLLNGLQTVIGNNTSTSAEIATARILKAYIFWTLTDRYGPIPYAEALKAVTPKYSKQEDIYPDLIKELTEAGAQMPNSGTQRGDIMYKDLSQWKRLANSLRMLMALRLSKKYPGATEYAATQFKLALNDAAGSISSNTDNFQVNYVGGGSDNAYSNPFYYTHLQIRDNGLSVPMYNMLASISDPRASVYGSSATAVPYGYNEGLINAWRQANPGWARVFSDAYRDKTSPVFVVTAGQVLLARAEAADRGWTSENANTVYTAGVTAAFQQWGLAAPSAGYLSNANVALTAPTGTGANLKNIATQFFLSTFPDGTQGWANWRRTGYPVLTPSPYPLSAAHTTIPRRFTYGLSEYSTNLSGVNQAIGWIPGGDVQESRVWWDQ
ncbi:MAG: SusD/RagB family nutrient-binding outer membrane lipoprotein [Chitinophagaceae bacterium]|nr:SusD/RagB family nutrient-binding outer membrane lipoprotein [Chitinophagaceae bacterium]